MPFLFLVCPAYLKKTQIFKVSKIQAKTRDGIIKIHSAAAVIFALFLVFPVSRLFSLWGI
jgi:hypothetical protein